jgi:hypothetical protein
MKRPESKDYVYTDPDMVELLGENFPDLMEYSIANKKYIDWLESELKILNKHFVIVPKGTACLMKSDFICPINNEVTQLCVDCDWYRQAAH